MKKLILILVMILNGFAQADNYRYSGNILSLAMKYEQGISPYDIKLEKGHFLCSDLIIESDETDGAIIALTAGLKAFCEVAEELKYTEGFRELVVSIDFPKRKKLIELPDSEKSEGITYRNRYEYREGFPRILPTGLDILTAEIKISYRRWAMNFNERVNLFLGVDGPNPWHHYNGTIGTVITNPLEALRCINEAEKSVFDRKKIYGLSVKDIEKAILSGDPINFQLENKTFEPLRYIGVSDNIVRNFVYTYGTIFTVLGSQTQ